MCVLTGLMCVVAGSFQCSISAATTVSLRLSGHLTAAGTCQQLSDTHIKCQIPAEVQGRLQLQATVSPSTSQVSVIAVSVPSWASFSPTTASGIATTTCTFTPPASVSGTSTQLVFRANVLGTPLTEDLTVTLDVGASSGQEYGPDITLQETDLIIPGRGLQQDATSLAAIFDVPFRRTDILDPVDGIIGDEWQDGLRTVIQIGDYPSILHARHDGANLFLAIELLDPPATLQPNDLTFCFVFDNGDGQLFGDGDDCVEVHIDDRLETDGDQHGAGSGRFESDDQQNAAGYGSWTPGDGGVTYTIEISRPIDSGDTYDVSLVPGQQSGFAFGLNGTSIPCGRPVEVYATMTLDVADETSICGPYAGVTDESGHISILIPWMDGELCVVGTLAEAPDLGLTDTPFSVTLVPKASGGSISAVQDVGAVIVHSTDDGVSGYGWEIVPLSGHGDGAADEFTFTSSVDPSGSTTVTMNLGDVCLETSPQRTLTGMSDASGGISVLIPWMDDGLYIAGTLTDCSGQILADTPISLTLEPKESGATISRVEDIEGVIVAAYRFLHEYSSDPVNDLTYTSSVDLSGNATAMLWLGDFCVQDVVCSAYSQAMSEMSDIEAHAVELHNLGRDASNAAAASELYQEALASQQLLVARIGDLVMLVGGSAELVALLDEAETDQRESVDLFARSYTAWAEAGVAYAQGDASYDKGDDAYDKGDDAYDDGDKAYDEGDYDRFDTLYDAGDAWYDKGDAFYDQGDVLYVQGDVLVGTGNVHVEEGEGLREEAWRLLKEVRGAFCGQEDAAEAEDV